MHGAMMTAEKKPLPTELIDALLANYKKPEDLISHDGILKQLTNALVKRALRADMTTTSPMVETRWWPTKLATRATSVARRLSRETSVNYPLKSPATGSVRSSRKLSPSTRLVGAALRTRFSRCTHGA
jgi:hypothetical protein